MAQEFLGRWVLWFHGRNKRTRKGERICQESKGTSCKGRKVKNPRTFSPRSFPIGNDIAVTFTKTYGPFGYHTTDEDNYQVFSYSDRPVYRPADMVHYKAVIRKKDNGNYAVSNGTFYAKFLLDYGSPDPNSTYQPLTVDQNGTVTYDVQLPQMITGSYPQITLSIKKADGTYKQIDSLPVVIQSYRKPDMDITATTTEKEYISSDNAHMTVFAKTNYGQPLSNVDFTYRVLVSSFQEMKDRTTENIERTVSGYYGNGDELVSGSGKFDSKGTAQIAFSANLPAKYELSQIATLEVTPNIGASPSIGKIAKLIHRGEFAIFINNLTGDNDNGISGTVSVLNHNSPRETVSNKAVTLSLYKVIDYNNKQQVQTQNVTSGSDGSVSFSFQKVDTGNYEVVAQGSDSRSNTVTSRQQVYIGQKQQYSPNNSPYNLTLKTPKDSYRPNETANLIAQANFSINDAVIVITNSNGSYSNIVSFSANPINNTAFVLPIPIKDEYGQGIGIDVYTINKGNVVRGYINIAISKEKQKLNTSISFDKPIYKPDDTVSATIITKDQQGNPVSADNSLAVIDASLLQIGQLNGDIFDSFYGSTPYSSVTHYDSTTGIMRNIGGGGGGCFTKGTKILMGDGSSKNIEDVKNGDKILTRISDQSPQLTIDTVVKTYYHAVTDYLTINNSLNVTWVHRIYLNGSWREAKEAKIGDTLLDENGNSVKITSITPHLGQFAVYNLTTARYHTFFTDGFYVHNEKGPGPRQNFADTAYWNPHIQTNTSGQATISFKLPDNITTFTAQVFSNTQVSQFGQTNSSLISQKDFNIIPALANFYYQGDKPIISALVQNSSSQDADMNIFLTIKELGLSKNQPVHINKGDFATAAFPLDINTQAKTLSFAIEAKDTNNNTVDSVLLSKPVLPKGNIIPSWMSFQGSKNITFTATYPTLDFNNIQLTVVPNIISELFHRSIYFDYQPSIAVGQQLFAYSYILAQTRDNKISPASYDYARYKNNFREVVSDLMQSRAGNYWNLPRYATAESFAAMNLWLTQGLNQAFKVHLLDEINNISSIIANTQQYIRSQNQPASSQEEQIAKQWVLNETPDAAYRNTPDSLAIRILNGENSLIEQLQSMSLPSAGDRYIWDGDTAYSQTLPALAIIEKGSPANADKAIKGLSSILIDPSSDPLSLLAGAEYAERRKFYADEPSIKVSVNDQIAYLTKEKQQYNRFTQSLPVKNSKDGKIKIDIETSGDVPIYTTIVQTDYGNQAISANNTEPLTFSDRVKQLLKPNGAQKDEGVKIVDINLTRSYKNIQTGQNVPELKQGEAGIVVLTGNNQFSKYLFNKHYYSNEKYAFILEDAISPSFIYLNQTSDYGNSPKYQSTLSRIFPGDNTYFGSAILPSNYSDEAVFFDTAPNQQPDLILPYVVYNVSDGTYYQPKTSLVFPVLGLIAPEK